MSYNIKRFALGVVVKYDEDCGGFRNTSWNYGHVIGFSQNCFKETILIIRGDDNTEHEIHPSNVLLDFNGEVVCF